MKKKEVLEQFKKEVKPLILKAISNFTEGGDTWQECELNTADFMRAVEKVSKTIPGVESYDEELCNVFVVVFKKVTNG